MSQALVPQPRLPAWRSYAGILLRRRPGARGGAPVPRVSRHTRDVCLDEDWLARYREIVDIGSPAPVLPPLALQIAAMPLHLAILADPRFPFRAMGLIHVGQRVDQIGALPERGVYRLEAYTAESQGVRQGSRFELITEARIEGRLVWRSALVALARHESEATESAFEPLSTLIPPGEPEVWSRVALMPAPEDLGRRYAAIAGDWNPIHQRAWLARPFGFARAIAPGAWTLARALAAAGWPRHEAFSLRAQFRKPVFLPSSLGVWTQTGPSVRHLRVTDDEGTVEHLVARIEPALAGLGGRSAHGRAPR